MHVVYGEVHEITDDETCNNHTLFRPTRKMIFFSTPVVQSKVLCRYKVVPPHNPWSHLISLNQCQHPSEMSFLLDHCLNIQMLWKCRPLLKLWPKWNLDRTILLPLAMRVSYHSNLMVGTVCRMLMSNRCNNCVRCICIR